MKFEGLPGRRLHQREILEYAPSGTRLPRNFHILVANGEYKEALILEGLRSLGVKVEERAKQRETIPTTSFHTVERVHYKVKQTAPADLAVKGIGRMFGQQSVTRPGKILKYLEHNGRPTAEFIGHIAGIPEEGWEEKEKKKRAETEEEAGELTEEQMLERQRNKKNAEIDALFGLGLEGKEQRPAGIIFTRWVHGTPLDDLRRHEREQKRETILTQLAEHFAFFHGPWETKEEKNRQPSKRKKLRLYVTIQDRKLGNFILDKHDKVHVIDPDMWDLTTRPAPRSERDADIREITRQAYKARLIETSAHMKMFVDRYLGAHLPGNGNEKTLTNAERLTAALWKTATESRVPPVCPPQ